MVNGGPGGRWAKVLNTGRFRGFEKGLPGPGWLKECVVSNVPKTEE